MQRLSEGATDEAAYKLYKKNVKIAAGLQCRHSVNRQELIKRIRDGQMGDINLIRAYRMDSGYNMGPHGPVDDELVWQVRHAYQFLWTSSGVFLELMIHQIDECCWLKDGWPLAAHGVGGRAPSSNSCSQNLEAYSVEYTFADGAKLFVDGRTMPGCKREFASYAHGTKGLGIVSTASHTPCPAARCAATPCRIP